MDATTTDSPLDAAFFTDILESNKDAVRAAVRDTMLESVKRQFEWEVPDAVKKAVTEFVSEEILPAIKAELLANKDVFVDAATELVRVAPVEIAKAMQEQVAKNLAYSWNVRKIAEALFQ